MFLFSRPFPIRGFVAYYSQRHHEHLIFSPSRHAPASSCDILPPRKPQTEQLQPAQPQRHHEHLIFSPSRHAPASSHDISPPRKPQPEQLQPAQPQQLEDDLEPGMLGPELEPGVFGSEDLHINRFGDRIQSATQDRPTGYDYLPRGCNYLDTLCRKIAKERYQEIIFNVRPPSYRGPGTRIRGRKILGQYIPKGILPKHYSDFELRRWQVKELGLVHKRVRRAYPSMPDNHKVQIFFALCDSRVMEHQGSVLEKIDDYVVNHVRKNYTREQESLQAQQLVESIIARWQESKARKIR